MKRLLWAGFALATLTAQASAADLPRRYIPPGFVPAFSWSGFYVGVNAGYGFGNSNWTDPVAGIATGDFSLGGGLVGGTIGYNMQLGGSVFGVEGDIAWSGIEGSTSTLCFGACKTANDWLGTLRGRAGYAFGRFLPYLTGGAAFGNVNATTSPDTGSFSSTNIGWTFGAGVEYAFFTNWSAKLEYRYVDLGSAESGDANNCPLDRSSRSTEGG